MVDHGRFRSGADDSGCRCRHGPGDAVSGSAASPTAECASFIPGAVIVLVHAVVLADVFVANFLVNSVSLEHADGFGSTFGFDKSDATMKRIFPPEFRNRLDAVVNFSSLPEPVILRIVDKFLLEVEQQLHERNVTVSATDPARHFFLKEGFKPEFGAREMGRVIQEHVKKPLADLILFGELAGGGHAEVDYVDGKVVVRAKKRATAAPAADAPAAT